SVSTVCLYAFSTTLVSDWLIRRAAYLPPLQHPPIVSAQAIVVLAGDVQKGNGPGGSDQVGLLTMERLTQAASLYRALGLPILVTGGRVAGSTGSLAQFMGDTLENAFGVPVKWREEQASTTEENAQNSAQLLRLSGITTVVVVTQAWHMPRALWSFERAGIQAIPATEFAGRPPFRIFDLLPAHNAFEHSFEALHELLGQLYYRWRYG
ncbi:MAG TPA: YdcF family protein, partial [Stellaceae bacterium]|nr:YdcF family protein [Stellaceae bacterium]